MPLYEVKAIRHYHTTIEVSTYVEALSPEQAKERIANEPHDWKENRASEETGEWHNELTDIEVYDTAMQWTDDKAKKTMTKVR